MSASTVASQIRNKIDQLTRSERQLADIILKNYPVSGLGTITTLATAAEVSTPTVARMVQKLGYSGFPEFQAALRDELNEKISGPIARRNVWANNAPDAHLLNRFTDAVTSNIRQTLGEIDTETFESACAMLVVVFLFATHWGVPALEILAPFAFASRLVFSMFKLILDRANKTLGVIELPTAVD